LNFKFNEFFLELRVTLDFHYTTRNSHSNRLATPQKIRLHKKERHHSLASLLVSG
jgi:hypothetical protein